MTNLLCYLIIIQPSGIPLYANSFDFDSDKECQTFNNRLTVDGTKKQLLGGIFSAIKDVAGEVLNDPLQFVNLTFDTFRIMALNINSILFLGIFEQYQNSKGQHLLDNSILNSMQKIATRFHQVYSAEQVNQVPVKSSLFSNFTNEIVDLGIPLVVEKCRNCLTKCRDENKECLPHLLYFENVPHQSSI